MTLVVRVKALNTAFCMQLIAPAHACYDENIRMCDNVDPYPLQPVLNTVTNVNEFPELMHRDIVNYLVYSSSFVTLEEMKAYKSIEAHNYFTSVCVASLSAKRLQGDNVPVVGEVNHSQRLGDRPLKVWTLCKKDGVVQTAHCRLCSAQCRLHMPGFISSITNILLEHIEGSFKHLLDDASELKWLTAPDLDELCEEPSVVTQPSPSVKLENSERSHDGELRRIRASGGGRPVFAGGPAAPLPRPSANDHGEAFDAGVRRSPLRLGRTAIPHRRFSGPLRGSRRQSGKRHRAVSDEPLWLVKLRTAEAKETLVRSGGIQVKGRYCAVIDPARQEVTVKVHWVPFDDPDEAVRDILCEFGEVKEIKREEWKVAGFDLPDSTTRTVRMTLHEGITPDSIPDMFAYGEGAVLCVVPGRAPTCLRCRMRGHIRRNCQTPQWAKCGKFGHTRQDCVRTYARVASNGRVSDTTSNLMDEEEAENAATAAASTADNERSSADVVAPAEAAPITTDGDGAKMAAQAANTRGRRRGSRKEWVYGAGFYACKPDTGEERGRTGGGYDTAERGGEGQRSGHGRDDGFLRKGPATRGTSALAAQRLRRLENEWKVVGRKKKFGSPSQRSTSLTRERKPEDGGSG
ncbi:hypothetical protein HPB48_011433 [Haemaphysalis longicornis]|uniref:CCHC-type domain-containing protein n=1 Tax=Haemaphysalis longicornis TaxID=44386 RepID=A0A9J6G8K9_HAELO|nr:hypothetical protein HPB48_011433 [Haemaphysalis longicornis]